METAEQSRLKEERREIGYGFVCVEEENATGVCEES